MEVDLTLTPVQISDKPVKIVSIFNVSVLYVGSLENKNAFTLNNEYVHNSFEPLFARSLVDPKSTINVTETGDSELIEPIEKTGSFIVTESESFNVVEINNGIVAVIVTFPLDITEDIDVGSWGEIRKTGSGQVSVEREVGVVFRSSEGDSDLVLSSSDGTSAFWEKTDSNTYLISGGVVLL